MLVPSSSALRIVSAVRAEAALNSSRSIPIAAGRRVAAGRSGGRRVDLQAIQNSGSVTWSASVAGSTDVHGFVAVRTRGALCGPVARHGQSDRAVVLQALGPVSNCGTTGQFDGSSMLRDVARTVAAPAVRAAW